MDEVTSDCDQNVKLEPRDMGSEVNILGLLPVIILISIMVIRLIFVLYKYGGQKTRSPQQRRAYIGNRPRSSLTPQEPTIYVSPANLPPPPKYESMAPPSYEEVVGIHYPGYRPVQPITAPITTAMAQSTAQDICSTNTNTSTETNIPTPATVVTITADRQTAVTVAT